MTRPWRTAALVLVTAVLVIGVYQAEAASAGAAIEDASEQERAGAFVLRGTPSETGQSISRQDCDGLETLPQVVHSGGLNDLGSVSFSGAPGNPMRLFTGSGSVASILDPTSSPVPHTPVRIAAAARHMMGLATLTVQLPSGSEVPFEAFDPGPRHASSQFMVLISSSSQTVDQCWVETRPGTTDATVLAVALALAPLDGRIEVSPVLDDPSTTSLETYNRRPAKYLWLASGIMGGLVLMLIAAQDRERAVLTRTLGATYLQAVSIGLFQAAVIVPWVATAFVGAWALATGARGNALTSGVIAAAAAASLMSSIGVIARFGFAAESMSRRIRRGRD